MRPRASPAVPYADIPVGRAKSDDVVFARNSPRGDLSDEVGVVGRPAGRLNGQPSSSGVRLQSSGRPLNRTTTWRTRPDFGSQPIMCRPACLARAALLSRVFPFRKLLPGSRRTVVCTVILSTFVSHWPTGRSKSCERAWFDDSAMFVSRTPASEPLAVLPSGQPSVYRLATGGCYLWSTPGATPSSMAAAAHHQFK